MSKKMIIQLHFISHDLHRDSLLKPALRTSYTQLF